jgi:drug/metabolite transporter (DMT)-like permease
MLSMAVAALLNTVPALHVGFFHAALTRESTLAALFLAVICSGVAYYLWFVAQHEHGPARVNALIYAEPVVGLVAGRVLLGERILPETVFGGICVLVGAGLVARGTRRPAPPLTTAVQCEASRPGRGFDP